MHTPPGEMGMCTNWQVSPHPSDFSKSRRQSLLPKTRLLLVYKARFSTGKEGAF